MIVQTDKLSPTETIFSTKYSHRCSKLQVLHLLQTEGHHWSGHIGTARFAIRFDKGHIRPVYQPFALLSDDISTLPPQMDNFVAVPSNRKLEIELLDAITVLTFFIYKYSSWRPQFITQVSNMSVGTKGKSVDHVKIKIETDAYDDDDHGYVKEGSESDDIGLFITDYIRDQLASNSPDDWLFFKHALGNRLKDHEYIRVFTFANTVVERYYNTRVEYQVHAALWHADYYTYNLNSQDNDIAIMKRHIWDALGRDKSWFTRANILRGILKRIGPNGTHPDAQVVMRLKDERKSKGLRSLMDFLAKRNSEIPIEVEDW
jgi:hypothetical protein